MTAPDDSPPAMDDDASPLAVAASVEQNGASPKRRGRGDLFVCMGDEVAMTFRGVAPLEETLTYARGLRRELGARVLGPACLELSPSTRDADAVRVALWGTVGASTLRVEADGNLFIAIRDAFHALARLIRSAAVSPAL